MEQSIESMWKEGFLKEDALVAPKVNDIYNKKSTHLIEKFERMFRNNIWGIVISASLLLIGAYFAGALLAGSIVFIMLLFVAYTAYQDLQALEKIDKGQSSYAFLKSFRDWIARSVDRYGALYRVVYPVLILAFYFGVWFSDVFASMRDVVAESTNDLIFGMHTYTTILMVVFAAAMGFFSKAIHRRDIKIIYGGIINKLDQALAEMEELRA